MKNSKQYTLIILISISGLCQAQVRKKSVPTRGGNVETKKEANDFFVLGDYSSARDAFANVYKTKPENTDVNFKLGYCYLVTHTDPAKAIPLFEFVAKQSDAPRDIYYYLGRAYLVNNR
jgi:predicted Zn-dependent protease